MNVKVKKFTRPMLCPSVNKQLTKKMPVLMWVRCINDTWTWVFKVLQVRANKHLIFKNTGKYIERVLEYHSISNIWQVCP